ncbi:hypothetical protein [Pseudomonas prosekii]|uniref:Uncharacterized protein n=1 Tax=Pseudomonas prosekii TaxID=1148509 RepID=A0A1H1YZ87_9PSED|nr:hypothetical protein [Pseudomonas prosekii]PWE45453.1 hypothetical protein C9I49_10950 [Pseudomonas prosekii]SDT26659.1 hypothetical protein SAMN05216222_3666 [Pseudomonas prosekii]
MIQPMKFKPRKTHPLHRLPYVGCENYVDRYGRIGYWDVPLAGGYNGGWQTGRALGNIAIKHMSQHDHDGDGGHLKSIASAWLQRASTATPDELDTLQGQVLGFMTVIGIWTHSAAAQSSCKLADCDEKTELKTANAGIGFPASGASRGSAVKQRTRSSNADSIKG